MLKSAEYNEKTISQAIKTKWAGKTVYFAEKVDSTNSWIKRLSKEGAEHGTLAVAEFQSAGRGRFDRKWEAPEGSSVMMTILLRPEFEPQYASMLTLVMGLAVAQAVDELGFKVSIKWPNDVVLSRKKICGILTEMGTNGTKIGYVLIGVGINVNLWEFPEEMQDKATSLAMESGQEYDRNQIIGLVMKHFEEDYERFIQTCDFENLLEEYREEQKEYTLYAPSDGTVLWMCPAADPLQKASPSVSAEQTVLLFADHTKLQLQSTRVSPAVLSSYERIYAIIDGKEYDVVPLENDIREDSVRAMEGKTLKTNYQILDDHVTAKAGTAVLCFQYNIAENVLTVPTGCTFHDTDYFVYRMNGNEREKVYVEIGTQGAVRVEIRSGLQEGDVVYAKP